MSINTRLIVFTLWGVTQCFGQSPQTINLNDINKMRTEDRAIFFANLSPTQLSDPNDFFDALTRGIVDGDVSVRRAATGKAAYAVVGLQQRKQKGQAIPVKSESFVAFQNALVDAMQDKDAQVRRVSAGALIYSDAPNKEVESALVAYFGSEADALLRISVAKDMHNAGYKSAAIDAQILAGLDDGDSQTRMEAARAAGLDRVAGALPKLALLLNDDEMVKGYVVEAISAYGSEAVTYLPQLEAMLASGTAGGTLINDLRRSIEAIKNPSPTTSTKAQIKPVSLVDTSFPAASAATATTAPDPQVPTPDYQPKSAKSPSSIVQAEQPKFTPWPWITGAILLLAVVVGILLKLRLK